MLKGEKVVLRPVKRADIPDFLIWFNDMEVIQYLGRILPLTEMEEEKWVENLAVDSTRINFVIETADLADNKPIGTVGLHKIENIHREAHFGIAIGDKEFWSNGYGTEAALLVLQYGFGSLNLHRISSNVFDFNLRSQKLHLKVGFKEEGRRRASRFINGQYRDILEYGILKEEWNTIT